MNLSLVSWNGDTRINDGTNYQALIIPGALMNLSSQAVYSERAQGFPYLSGVVLPPHTFTFQIVTPASANIATQRELLKQIFNLLDFTPHTLVAKDTADSNKQYYLTGFPIRLVNDPSNTADTSFLITLAVFDPIWRTVTASTDSWSVTATGQQRTLAVGGNTYAQPVFTLTPTVARTDSWAYIRWVQINNRVARALPSYALDVTNGGINTSTLINDTTVSNQINLVGGITAVQTTIPIDTAVGGGLPVSGMGYCGTEQISWTGNTGTNLTGVTRGIGGTTAAVHADNAVIARSKMLANGDDLRILVDGVQVDRWLNGINTATTKVWINQSWSPAQTGTLRVALANAGTPVTVTFTKNATNLAVLKALKAAPNSAFLIDSEMFTFSPANIDLVNYQITSCKRGQKYTSNASHAVNASIIFIEHDIWLMYGNQFALTPVTDDTRKPLLNLSTSTNTSWVFSNYYDSTAPARPGSWNGQVISSAGKQSKTFTDDQGAIVNPSVELGLQLLNYQVANVWKAETATLAWSFYHPTGITTVSLSGKKYVYSLTTWPATAGLQKSADGRTWSSVWNEAKPTVAQTWQALAAHSAVSLSGTYLNIRYVISGTIANLSNNEADIQGDTITLALDSTKTPSIVLGTEQNTGAFYYFSVTLTNTTTGEYIILNVAVPLNGTLTVDTVNKLMYLSDGSNVIGGLQLSANRSEWLKLNPAANNVLQYDDAGTTGVTVVTTWNNRNM